MTDSRAEEVRHQVVAVTWPDFQASYPTGEARLRQAGLHVRFEPKLGERSEDDVLEIVEGAAGAIVSTDPFTSRVIGQSPTLKVIARVGVGTDSVDLEAADAAGVAVTVTTGANEATVADHAVALMLGALRDLVAHDERVKAGRWLRTGKFTPSQLTGAVVLIVGFGAIGRLVKDRIAGFDTTVLVCDPCAREELGIEVVDLASGLRRADVVTLHTPLTPATRGLIGARELSTMRPGSVLVNLSRGGVVDEDALYHALLAGRPARAAIDVFATEPPRDSPLIGLPTVLTSPHIGGVSHQSLSAMLARATSSVIDVLAGKASADTINLGTHGRLMSTGREATHA